MPGPPHIYQEGRVLRRVHVGPEQGREGEEGERVRRCGWPHQPPNQAERTPTNEPQPQPTSNPAIPKHKEFLQQQLDDAPDGVVRLVRQDSVANPGYKWKSTVKKKPPPILKRRPSVIAFKEVLSVSILASSIAWYRAHPGQVQGPGPIVLALNPLALEPPSTYCKNNPTPNQCVIGHGP